MAKRSKRGKFNIRDIGHGALVAIITSVLGGIEQLIVNGGNINEVNHGMIVNWALVAGVGYVVKKISTNSEGQVLQPEPKKPDTDKP